MSNQAPVPNESSEKLAAGANSTTAIKSPSISFRLEPQYIEGLDRLAQLSGIDRTEALRQLIVEGCKARGVPLRKVALPIDDFHRNVYHIYTKALLNSYLALPGFKVELGSKLSPAKQYELKIYPKGRPNSPVLIGVAELYNTSNFPSIYWYFPAQGGLAEQEGELSKDNTNFNVELPTG